MAQLELHHQEIEAAGVNVVAVGLGQPKHARRYCGRLAPSIDCYCHETADLHQTYGLERAGLSQLVKPGLMKASLRATLRGHRQGKATGDVKMLPGTFIVDEQGTIRAVYYSSHAGDDPDISELLRTVSQQEAGAEQRD